MHDHLNARDDDGLNSGRKRNGEPVKPLADREVPLASGATTDMSAIHAWLDGDAADVAITNSDTARQVELWRRIEADTAAMRSVRAPMSLERNVMAAIAGTAPDAAAAPALSTPTVAPRADEAASWWQRPAEISPLTMFVGGAALLGLGALLGRVLR